MEDTVGSALPARGLKLPLSLSIALRELRAGAGGLAVFVLCITLGVASVASIGSLAASFDEGLARQGRTLVGGDLSFERVHQSASAKERATLDALGSISESASLRAMARNAEGKSALAEVKAVDAAFPLYGKAAVADPPGADAPWREPGKVVVERTLLDRLGSSTSSPEPSATSRTGSPIAWPTARKC